MKALKTVGIRQAQVLQYLKQNPTATGLDVATKFNVSRANARNIIAGLKKAGILTKTLPVWKVSGVKLEAVDNALESATPAGNRGRKKGGRPVVSVHA